MSPMKRLQRTPVSDVCAGSRHPILTTELRDLQIQGTQFNVIHNLQTQHGLSKFQVASRHRVHFVQDDTWVVLSGLEDSSTYERYITAIYWSMSTLCTVGYGGAALAHTNPVHVVTPSRTALAEALAWSSQIRGELAPCGYQRWLRTRSCCSCTPHFCIQFTRARFLITCHDCTDVTPGNASEKVVAMVGMVVGVTIFGYVMGAMGSMLSKMNSSDVRRCMLRCRQHADAARRDLIERCRLGCRSSALRAILILPCRRNRRYYRINLRAWMHVLALKNSDSSTERLAESIWVVAVQALISNYMSELDDFLRMNQVPADLATRTNAFMRYVLYRKPLVASEQLLSELSTPLRTEIVLHMYRETIACVPFLAKKDPQFVVAFVTLLQLQYFAPGDVVVRQNEVGDSILFLKKGVLEVRNIVCACTS